MCLWSIASNVPRRTDPAGVLQSIGQPTGGSRPQALNRAPGQYATGFATLALTRAPPLFVILGSAALEIVIQ